MKKVIIKRVSYQGFYGQTRKVDFSPAETTIRGDVKLGKTTILNAIMWCLTGCDLEGRQNYMLYDQTTRFTHDYAGRAEVEVVFDVDGQEMALKRTAKQKWGRDRGSDRWVKASSDEYRYHIDDLEVTKAEYDLWVDQKIVSAKKLALVANINQWQRMSWRTLREAFQSTVGEILPSDFKHDYSDVTGIIETLGLEKARQEFTNRINKYERQLDEMRIQEDENKKRLLDTRDADAAEVRIKEINDELAELDRQQSAVSTDNHNAITRRDEIAREIALKERLYRDEYEDYNDKHNKHLRQLQDTYNAAVKANNDGVSDKLRWTRMVDTAKSRKIALAAEIEHLRERYREVEKSFFDNICPTCGRELPQGDCAEALKSFRQNRDRSLMEIKSKGEYTKEQLMIVETDIKKYEKGLAEIKAIDVTDMLAEYEKAESSFVPFDKTGRGRTLLDEIETLKASMPEPTWIDAINDILNRKADLHIELKKQMEIAAEKASNQRIKDRIEEINREQHSTMVAMSQTQKAKDLIWEYERELAEIIRYRSNKLFPDRTQVVMSKYKKNGDVDFDVCQICINGKDATATNTADRQNAGIDVSTVFMRFCDVNFPLLIDGAESNTEIECYGRQVIKTVVDETCKEIVIETAPTAAEEAYDTESV